MQPAQDRRRVRQLGPDDHEEGTTTEDSGEPCTAQTWFLDADGDTYGNPDASTSACTAPEGYVAASGDCDDALAGVNPGAHERCETAVDDDCDGVINEADAVDADTWYADTDADGHGDATSTAVACTVPADHVKLDDDCDDSDGTVSASAVEVCSDGVDNNCDGSADPCVYGGDVVISDVAVGIEGVAGVAEVRAKSSAGDVNGDGIADLTIRQIYGDGFFVVHGPVTADLELLSSDAQVTADVDARWVGRTHTVAGDVNGDGLPDLLLGTGSDSYTYAAYVLDGTVTGSIELDTAPAAMLARFTPEAADNGAGTDVVGDFDLDADGAADIAISAHLGDAVANDGGQAYVWYGGSFGDGATHALADAPLRLVDSQVEGQFGIVADAADMDGDGLDDLIVHSLGGTAGTAWILPGSGL